MLLGLDDSSALVASTGITAFASVVAATIALLANRNAKAAKQNTQPNGGSSSHDQLMGRIDGWGMTLERQIRDAASAASDADRNARLAVGAAKQSDVLLGVVARDLNAARASLDDHLAASAEYGQVFVEAGRQLVEKVDALERKVDGHG